jgi:uncharacterized protein
MNEKGAAVDYPSGMVGREPEWARLNEFVASNEAAPTLSIVWGRRRVGKSFLLETVADQTQGFYYSAIRGSSGEGLRDLGARLAAFTGSVAPFAFPDWEAAILALLALGKDRQTVIVLDEYPYLLEHTPELDSIIQRALGSRASARGGVRTRLVLCGSAMSVMSKLLVGTAALRGRAGLDLRVSPFTLRTARTLHGIEDFRTAFRTYAVIGGVAAYGREMVANDVPISAADFNRWICRRVLTPAAPLFSEVDLLMSEDPATAKARKLNLYHAVLAGVASGNHAHNTLTSYVKISGASLTPVIDSLVSAELITRVHDPLRDNRPTYHPADPLLRFHYAIIRPNHSRLARHDAATSDIWQQLLPTFESQVIGPCFESVARDWTQHIASQQTLSGTPAHVGPTIVTLADGSECQIDVVVADAAESPSARTVHALGEAKAGERITMAHVKVLERAREALGVRATNAKLLCFGSRISPEVHRNAAQRTDLEIVDLERLYGGT